MTRFSGHTSFVPRRRALTSTSQPISCWTESSSLGRLAIIFSNDSDLREPIRVAQQPPFNLTVWVVNPRFKPKTKMSATHHIDLSIGDVRDSQFPDDVTLSDGKVVTRPETWRQEEDP